MKKITTVIGPVKVNNEKEWTVQIWFEDGVCRTTTHSSKKAGLDHIKEVKSFSA